MSRGELPDPGVARVVAVSDGSDIALISRALARHDAVALYTILRSHFPQRAIGPAMLEFIRTQPDWPVPREEDLPDTTEALSAPERAVLICAAGGRTVEETSRELYRSPLTIKHHRKAIIAKLGAANMREAVAIAIRRGVI